MLKEKNRYNELKTMFPRKLPELTGLVKWTISIQELDMPLNSVDCPYAGFVGDFANQKHEIFKDTAIHQMHAFQRKPHDVPEWQFSVKDWSRFVSVRSSCLKFKIMKLS